MILEIFSVRDEKTDQFGTPMFLVNKGHAIRSVADEVNRKDRENMLSTHPEDFALWSLGTFDTQKGVFNAHAPEQVVLLSELVK